jgi:hypothetical protein
MEKQGKVVGICMSQKQTDLKKNVGRGFLQKGLGLVGDSHPERGCFGHCSVRG